MIMTMFRHIKHITQVNAIFLFNSIKSQDRYFNGVLKCSKYYWNSWTNRLSVLKINEIHIFKRNGQLWLWRATQLLVTAKTKLNRSLRIHNDSLHSDKNTSWNEKLTEEVCEWIMSRAKSEKFKAPNTTRSVSLDRTTELLENRGVTKTGSPVLSAGLLIFTIIVLIILLSGSPVKFVLSLWFTVIYLLLHTFNHSTVNKKTITWKDWRSHEPWHFLLLWIQRQNKLDNSESKK